MKTILIAGLLLTGTSILLSQSSTQTDSVFEGTTPTGLAPGSPAGSSAISQIERYSPFSGTLNPAIPLYQVGGRGEATLNLMWPISQMWRTSTTSVAQWPTPPPEGEMPTFSYTQKFLPPQPWTPAGQFISAGTVWGRHGNSYEGCALGSSPTPTSPIYTLSKLTFTASDGTETELIDAESEATPSVVVHPCSYGIQWGANATRGSQFFSTSGGTELWFAGDTVQDTLSPASTQFEIDGTLYFPNGVTYAVTDSRVSFIRDRNGNQISATYSNNALTQITDQLGRIISINYQDPSCGCITLTYPGYQGASRVIKIYSAQLANVLRAGFSIEPYDQLFPADTTDQGQFNPTVLSAVQYPDGRELTFQYDSYAELARINLPTGGAVEYDYGDGSNGNTSGYQLQSGGSTSIIYRRLQERREYSNGSTLSSRTHYTVSYPNSNTVDTEVTYDASGNVVGQAVHTMNGSPLDSFHIVGIACNA